MVIDVLRATTVITRALQAGAADVIVCGEIDAAVQLAQSLQPRPLLCGERACQPIPGFDLGNSPAEYRRQRVAGRRLVMTTTNGTRAVLAANRFPRILAASFNNITATLDQIPPAGELTLLCAGTDGEVTEEDLLLAGALLDGLLRRDGRTIAGDGAASPTRSDEAYDGRRDGRTTASDGATPEAEARQMWLDHLASGQPLAERLAETTGGRNLVTAGYHDDIAACAEIDVATAVGIIDPSPPLHFRRII